MRNLTLSLRSVLGCLLVILACVVMPAGSAQAQCSGIDLNLESSPTSTPLESTLSIDIVNLTSGLQSFSLFSFMPSGVFLIDLISESISCSFDENGFGCGVGLNPGESASIMIVLSAITGGTFPLTVNVQGTINCSDVANLFFVSEEPDNCADACALEDGTMVGDRIVRKVTPGNPNISGSNDDEILCGDDRKNKLSGNGGSDILCGFGNKDKLDGGSGNDLLFGNGGNDKLDGGPDDDTLVGGNGNDDLEGSGGNDDLFGDDSPFGSDNGASGRDKLNGGSDNDGLFGGPEKDKLDGGSGNDDLFGQEGDDRLKAGTGNDVLVGGGDNDQLEGSDDDDKLFGDQLESGLLDSFIRFFGFDPSDTGPAGDDKLFGGPDDDELFGGPGDDQLRGGPGTNELDGEGGTDTCKSNAGDTVMNCEK